jgi:hypothetical protein
VRNLWLVAVFFAFRVPASVPIPTTIEELAKGADHIVIGHVVDVDMVDGSGKQIKDEKGRTGPGLKNTIRLHVVVDEVLATSSRKEFPKLLKLPLDPFMHYTLGQIKAAHSKPSGPFLVLLKGPPFLPVVPGALLRSLDEKETALRIHARSHPQRASKASSKPKPRGE